MSISISKEHGVNPTIETKICLIDGKEFETNSVLLLGRNKGKKAEHKTCTGYDFCPECQELLDKKFTALIVADPNKSEVLPNGNMKFDSANRTGEIVWLKNSVANQIFDVDIKNHKFLFIDIEAASKIKEIIPK